MADKVRMNVHGSRCMGRGGDHFELRVWDEAGRGLIVRLTPEQWALALSGRGDVWADGEFVEPVL